MPLHASSLLVVVCAAVCVVLAQQRRGRRPLHLVTDAHGNESLVVEADVGGLHTLFLIDTAYAGAPVLSTSFLSVQRACLRGGGGVRARAARCLRALRTDVTEDARQDAVTQELLQRTQCRAFTSGCTMKLMGIGTTVETQADMLLCPALRLAGRGDVDAVQADVLVTNPLRGSMHILTVDYLLHRAPATLLLSRGALVFHDDWSAPFFTHVPAETVGGAFVVSVDVGGTPLRVVLDTGAGAPLSLSAAAARRVARLRVPDARAHTTQVGVNGERVCSDLRAAQVRVAGIDLGEVAVLVNDTPIQGADGYAGMGLLRALDMRFVPGSVGLRPSGLPPATPATTPGACAAFA